MDERQALPVGPEESSESVHGPGPEQAQPHPQAPPAVSRRSSGRSRGRSLREMAGAWGW